ncbi:MAG: hypothetical protein JSV88_17190 [Candidatus Aminicenantes bacterium]|nr:MAG: hypothetical protein JSV88_17190 [Candidatus Aminicenantes bacterium]
MNKKVMTHQPSFIPGRKSPGFIGRRIGLVGIFFIVFFFLTSCTPKSQEETPVNGFYACDAEQWAFDTQYRYTYGHDCKPFYSNHFTIYSDGSSPEAKQQQAQMAEEIFSELVQIFQIQDITEELQFTNGYTYYIYAQKHLDNIKSMAYRNGFFIPAIDCVTLPGIYTNNPWGYRITTKHEMIHVFQFTLTDCPTNNGCTYWLHMWFYEGQAIGMSDPRDRARVNTLAEYNQWISDPDHGNPISIRRWSDFPDQDLFSEYCPMFCLAYEYLVDQEYGHGATIGHIRTLFQLKKDGDRFEEAFEKVMNMSIPYYEENFYTLIEEYLEKRALPPLPPLNI